MIILTEWPTTGWYCHKCNAIYFNPGADLDHTDYHEGVEVLEMKHRE